MSIDSLKLPARAEFENRWAKVNEEMLKSGFEALLVYSNDKAVHGPGDVRYLSNFPAHFEDVAILILKDNNPILLTGPECKEYAENVSYIKDVRVIEEFSLPGESYPFTSMTNLKNIIIEYEKKAKSKIKKIGFVGFDIIPYDTFKRIKRSISEDRIILNAKDITNKLRSIKSKWEQEIIIEGYKLNKIALVEAINNIRQGVSELKIASIIEKKLRENNSEGGAVDTIVAFGQKNTRVVVTRASINKLKKNDFGLLTFGSKLFGYCPAIGRPFYIGKANKNFIEASKIALEAQSECINNLKPGLLGREVEAIARKILSNCNLDKFFVYTGIHGIGLAEFEYPIFGNNSDVVIEPGMVLSIDIPIFLAPWGGVRVEDGFLITKNGNMQLSNYYKDIIFIK
ncbi:MAG: M24 family metallopeptidase [Candidatus Humimicrobiaceae bacterium]